MTTASEKGRVSLVHDVLYITLLRLLVSVLKGHNSPATPAVLAAILHYEENVCAEIQTYLIPKYTDGTYMAYFLVLKILWRSFMGSLCPGEVVFDNMGNAELYVRIPIAAL